MSKLQLLIALVAVMPAMARAAMVDDYLERYFEIFPALNGTGSRGNSTETSPVAC